MKIPIWRILLDLPNDDVAQVVARFLAEKTGREVVVSDSENCELWTIRPKLDS